MGRAAGLVRGTVSGPPVLASLKPSERTGHDPGRGHRGRSGDLGFPAPSRRPQAGAEDSSSYLLLVLDTSGGRRDDGGPVSNGPRLVSKSSGEVIRLTVSDALARAERMAVVRA